MNQKATPEERLLRLIESGQKNPHGGGGTHKVPFWDLRTWGRRLFPQFNRSTAAFTRMGLIPEFKLVWVNRVLIVLLMLVLAGIIFNANNTRSIPKSLMNTVDVPKPDLGGEPVENTRTASLKPLADYLKDVEKRSLFLPAPLPKPVAPVVSKEPTQPLKPPAPDPLMILREKVKSLKLVGISWGERPVAMIENKATMETSFIKVGESINEVEVKAILKDRAILSYGDAEYDLF